MFGKVARQKTDHSLTQCTFFGHGLEPFTEHYIRKVGRPKLNWTRELLDEATTMAGGQAALMNIVKDEKTWRQHVNTYSSKRL